MQISDKFLDTLRSRLALAELVGRKVKLTRKGREFTGLCPFHKEKTPSFTVNEEKEFYHCFGCGAHGDGIRFLMETQSYTFREAVEELSRQVGLALPEESSSQTAPPEDLGSLKEALQEAHLWFQNNLSQGEGVKALRYMEKRGLSRETVRKFCLGYAPEDRHALEKHLKAKGFSSDVLLRAGLLVDAERGAPYDRFRGRLMFPIRDTKGYIVGFGGRLLEKGEPKYLNSPETPLFSKGKLLYGYIHAKEKSPSDPLLIVEGYMDVISLQQAGILGAVAPLGTALTEDQIRLAWRLNPEPMLCFDGDAAGLKAAARAAERVLPLLKPGYSLRFILLPSGEDPDSLVQKGKFFQALETKAYSLLEILWMVATNGKSFKTPEQKAALQQQWEVWEKGITNPEIRKHYHYAFKDLFYKNIIAKKENKSLGFSLKKGELDFVLLQERLLLAILINHPQIIDDVNEDLLTLDFRYGRHRDMREAVLQFYADNSLDDEALKPYLLEKGFEEEIKGLFSHQVLIHGACAKASASKEEAYAGWQEIFARFNAIHHQEDLKIAQDDFAEDMSEKTWQRLKMLKETIAN